MVTEEKKTDIPGGTGAAGRMGDGEIGYRILFEEAMTPLFVVDEAGWYVDANKAALRFLECDRETLRARRVWDFASPDRLERQRREHSPFMEPRTVETDYLVNGRIKTLLLSVAPLRIGGRTLLFGTGQDITERKRAEAALRESEERFKTIFEGSRDAIFLTSEEARIVHVNQAACQLTGYAGEELMAMSIPDLHAPEDLHAYERFFDRIMAGETILSEADILRRDGLKVPAEFSNGRVSLGGKFFMHTVARDITDRKQAEAEKARLEAQFYHAQKLESIGRLAGGVAHDLNNLLSPILGYGEMLLEDTGGSDPRREPVEEMVKAAQKARDLVRQLLAFSRRQALEFKPLDLNGLLLDFEKLLRRTIREDIAIRMRLTSGPLFVQGDRGQLEQVIMNLAVNAQDAMPDGGILTIETGQAEPDAAPGAAQERRPAEHRALMIVSDTGCGIAPGIRESLFEPFFTTKETGKGTGLGLATVYGIIKQHGGAVRALSEPGKGAAFTIDLPASAAPAEGNWHSVPAPAIPRGAETVLLVEDNAQVRDLALTILKREGYTVLSAEGGEAALAALEWHEGPLHLLLTDVVMPDLNGRQLFDRVSALYPDIKVLYMSGYAENVIVHRGMVDPGVHFIQKPFSVKVLAAKVREALDG